MRDNILLVTKDALAKDYLPIYGNKIWKGKTPNIDELSEKGTVFNWHYTAAPSTVMSFRSMITGKFAHEQPYSNYTPKEIPGSNTDMFQIAERLGYEGHIVWDSTWTKMVLRYGNCYGSNTTFHNMESIKQAVGCHHHHFNKLINNEDKVLDTINRIVNEIRSIVESQNKVFIWLHLPHVINGRTSYGSDIDVLDTLIGHLRSLFSDENIFISADHGNMNGYRGKWGYGFDVNTSAIEIPLITPQIEGLSECNVTTSNIDIKALIFERKITYRDYIFSDSAYFAQPHRKLSIIHHNFAYIFNKEDSTEELYDLSNDRYERINLLKSVDYDIDRKVKAPVRDYYYSPYWDDVDKIVEDFRAKRDSIWRKGRALDEMKEKYLRKMKFFVKNFFSRRLGCNAKIL